MTRKELTKAIKEATYIYGYVQFNQDSGGYIRLQKTDALRVIQQTDDFEILQRADAIYIS